MERRRFLKATAALATTLASGATAGCSVDPLRPLLAAPARHPAVVERKPTICDMCVNKCAVVARVEDGVAVKLDPHPRYPKSRAMLCARGNAGLRQLYDPDRLKYPMLRVGERGGGRWRRLTWDEALDLTAERFSAIAEKYTRCGVLFMAGSDMQSRFVRRFAEAFGSYNFVSHESLCQISRNLAQSETFGDVPVPDVLNSRYVLLVGANRFESFITPDTVDLNTAMRGGCKVVVLDPRFTKTAARANEWLPIRPGTDMAFFLAVAHVLVAEELYDRQFVARNTSGFERLAAHVRRYPPQWAAEECDLPAEAIRRVARELAQAAPRALVYPCRRSSDYRSSTQTQRAIAIVNVLLGNWDASGGLLASRPSVLREPPIEPPSYESNPDGRVDEGVIPLASPEEGSFTLVRDAVASGEPYPVKGWFLYKTNPLQSAGSRRKTLEMIDRLDFMVAVDIVPSDTAWMADLILPSQTYLERFDPAEQLQAPGECACVVARDPVVEPLHESRPLFWMVQELAKRLGLDEHFDFTLAEYRRRQLAGLPEAEADIAKDGFHLLTSETSGKRREGPFRTPSGKIELYSSRYAKLGLDPMPVYVPVDRPPSGRFRLILGRSALVTNCGTQNNSLLAELVGECSLRLHPASAAAIGLRDGDRVRARSAAGVVETTVRLTETLRRDVAFMESGYGTLSGGLSAICGKGACVADLIEAQADPLSGILAMHETFITVEKKERNT